MPISVRLPPRIEQELARYCTSNRLTKSEAVKRALEQLFAQASDESTAYRTSAAFRGSDKTPGDVARDSARILRERFRGKR
jgi:Arc/MetJ-type ribon-helix-helix transcriptional regulator